MRFLRVTWMAIALLLISQESTDYWDKKLSYSPTTVSPKNLHFDKIINLKRNNAVDTHQLKGSSWYSNALQSIAASEYHIKSATSAGAYTAPNREQNLRAFYTANAFTLQPRKDSTHQWNLQFTTLGVYAGDQLLYSPDANAATFLSGDTIRFHHANNFTTEYINNEKGIRQNFIITQKPDIATASISVHLQINDGWIVNKTNPTEIQFSRMEAGGYQRKLSYNQLKVWDALHKELDASFQVSGNEISIDVNTEGAVYPVMIDPISTTPNTIFYGQQAGASMGYSVASAGDVNGDGFSDVILGARNFDNGEANEGMAVIYHGSANGISSGPIIQLECNQAGAAFGYSVSSAGDLNGDGYSDIVVGAPFYGNGETTEGAAFVYQGSASGINAVPMAILESNQDNAQMGNSVALAGDVNGDSYSDLIIGSRFYDNGESDEGAAFIFHGSATGINPVAVTMMESNQAGGDFGASVASAGDVNGDGFSDVIVGANTFDNGQTNEGAVFIFHGSPAGINAVAAIRLESNQAFSLMGSAVCSAGDVNGDGYSDILVGAYLYDSGATDDGMVFLYQGSAAGITSAPSSTFNSNQASGQMGTSVAPAGDVNGDGYSDILIGAQNYDNGQADEGTVFLYLGGALGINSSQGATFEMNQAFASFGSSVASAGDVNGDGFSDILVGACNYDFLQNDEGLVYLYFGAPDGPSSKPQFLSYVTQGGARFGSDVNAAGDLNGDGFGDVIIGASLYDDNGADEGRCFLFYGSSTGIALTPNLILDEANQGSSYFGYSAGSAGDINGDGYGDLVIGAFGYNGKGRVYIYWGSATGITPLSNQVLDGIQNGEAFGISVSTAGDVNRDGYSDILIGAYSYDDGANADEGRVLLFHGSASGINPVPATILSDANKAGASFGFSAATAGDVNGDGYSDVIIGAYTYSGTNAAQGVAFVYYGGCTGIASPANLILTGSGQANAMFGISVAAAGDINGDGFGDVVAGEWGYNSGSGRAYIFYGSAAGLSATGIALDNNASGNAANDNMGISVNSAGDINGDGYSDIIIGISQFNNPGSGPPQGRAYVYLGKSAGISNTPDFILTDNTVKTFFGSTVAGAGDINGDGFSDLVIGGNGGSWGVTGNAWIYYGNNSIGLRQYHRLYNTNLTELMTQANIDDANQFGAGLFAKSFLGRQKGKMVWHTTGNGLTFPGTPLGNSTQFTAQQNSNTDLGLTGVELKAVIDKLASPNTYTRTRLKYDMATAITGQVYGPWRYAEAYQRGNRSIPNAGMKRSTLKLGNDTTVCFGTPFLINATTIGATHYSWQDGTTGPVYSATGPGIYWVDVLVGGCSLRDSIVLSGIALRRDTLNPKICAGQSYASPLGQLLTTTGLYRDTLRAVNGCDSVHIIINLTVQTTSTLNITTSVCAGQSYTLPWGKVVNTSGIYRDTLRYISGCDSVYRTVTITVLTPQVAPTVNAVTCAGQSYTLPWGAVVTSPGTYRDTIRYTGTGCDSIRRTVVLTVQSAQSTNTSVTICQGKAYTLPWGTIATSTGIYRDTLRYSTTGCDSLYRIVQVNVTAAAVSFTNASICFGENYTLPWGRLVTAAGIYRDTLRNVLGCDSLVKTVTLQVNPQPTATINKSNDIDCLIGISKLQANGGVKYVWTPSNGLSNAVINNPVASPASTTTYKVRVTNANGCSIEDTITVYVNKTGSANGFQLPNAFSPNNDGRNDCFGVRTWGNISNLKFQVFNRWGQLVFSTTDPSHCWDGTVKGVLQPTSAFIYVISAETLCGPVKRTGTVMLIR